MQRWLALVPMTLLTVVGFAPVQSQSPPAGDNLYTVQYTLQDGETVIGTPKVALRAGEPAIVTVPQADGYSLRTILTPSLESGLQKANLETEVYFARDDQWVLVASPRVSIAMDEEGTFEVQSRNLGRKFRMEYKVTQGAEELASTEQINGRRCTEAKQAAWREAIIAPVSALFVETEGPPAPPTMQGCCDTGCLKCCGVSACCWDHTNCLGGCCT